MQIQKCDDNLFWTFKVRNESSMVNPKIRGDGGTETVISFVELLSQLDTIIENASNYNITL